jgi:AcrR family transcriptional regulator
MTRARTNIDGVPRTEDELNRVPRTKAEQRAISMELILDSAEELFSKFGYHGVTIKDLAKKVGVHPALVHYYFEGKLELFSAVFERRAAISNQRRLDALVQYEMLTGDSPTVEGALHAFLDTEFDTYIVGDKGWRNFGSLAAQASSAPGWGAERVHEHFDAVITRLISVLAKALPGCSLKDVHWCWHFVAGSLMLSLARTGRIDNLSNGLCSSEDFPAIKARMADFMAAGFRTICKPGVAKRAVSAPKVAKRAVSAPEVAKRTISAPKVAKRAISALKEGEEAARARKSGNKSSRRGSHG